jgi:pentatricopeptide repeat protein
MSSLLRLATTATAKTRGGEGLLQHLLSHNPRFSFSSAHTFPSSSSSFFSSLTLQPSSPIAAASSSSSSSSSSSPSSSSIASLLGSSSVIANGSSRSSFHLVSSFSSSLPSSSISCSFSSQQRCFFSSSSPSSPSSSSSQIINKKKKLIGKLRSDSNSASSSFSSYSSSSSSSAVRSRDRTKSPSSDFTSYSPRHGSAHRPNRSSSPPPLPSSPSSSRHGSHRPNRSSPPPPFPSSSRHDSAHRQNRPSSSSSSPSSSQFKTFPKGSSSSASTSTSSSLSPFSSTRKKERKDLKGRGRDDMKQTYTVKERKGGRREEEGNGKGEREKGREREEKGEEEEGDPVLIALTKRIKHMSSQDAQKLFDSTLSSSSTFRSSFPSPSSQEGKRGVNGADVNVYTALLWCYAREGDGSGAVRVFNSLRQEQGLQPTIVTYEALLEAFSKAKDLKRTSYYYQLLLSEGFNPTKRLLNSYLSCLASCSSSSASASASSSSSQKDGNTISGEVALEKAFQLAESVIGRTLNQHSPSSSSSSLSSSSSSSAQHQQGRNVWYTQQLPDLEQQQLLRDEGEEEDGGPVLLREEEGEGEREEAGLEAEETEEKGHKEASEEGRLTTVNEYEEWKGKELVDNTTFMNLGRMALSAGKPEVVLSLYRTMMLSEDWNGVLERQTDLLQLLIDSIALKLTSRSSSPPSPSPSPSPSSSPSSSSTTTTPLPTSSSLSEYESPLSSFDFGLFRFGLEEIGRLPNVSQFKEPVLKLMSVFESQLSVTPIHMLFLKPSSTSSSPPPPPSSTPSSTFSSSSQLQLTKEFFHTVIHLHSWSIKLSLKWFRIASRFFEHDESLYGHLISLAYSSRQHSLVRSLYAEMRHADIQPSLSTSAFALSSLSYESDFKEAYLLERSIRNQFKTVENNNKSVMKKNKNKNKNQNKIQNNNININTTTNNNNNNNNNSLSLDVYNAILQLRAQSPSALDLHNSPLDRIEEEEEGGISVETLIAAFKGHQQNISLLPPPPPPPAQPVFPSFSMKAVMEIVEELEKARDSVSSQPLKPNLLTVKWVAFALGRRRQSLDLLIGLLAKHNILVTGDVFNTLASSYQKGAEPIDPNSLEQQHGPLFSDAQAEEALWGNTSENNTSSSRARNKDGDLPSLLLQPSSSSSGSSESNSGVTSDEEYFSNTAKLKRIYESLRDAKLLVTDDAFRVALSRFLSLDMFTEVGTLVQRDLKMANITLPPRFYKLANRKLTAKKRSIVASGKRLEARRQRDEERRTEEGEERQEGKEGKKGRKEGRKGEGKEGWKARKEAGRKEGSTGMKEGSREGGKDVRKEGRDESKKENRKTGRKENRNEGNREPRKEGRE